ncbi:MAG TPA: hypothetical protein VGO62_04595 [Myxococcota bacterium]|jgi:hypothetical protein
MLLLALAPCTAACTYVVVEDQLHEDAHAPCHKLGDCAAGFACSSTDVCTAVPDADAPPSAGTLVDEAGADVSGPNGVVIHIGKDALSAPVNVLVDTASATNVPVIAPVSSFIAVRPSAPLTGVTTTIAIPVAAGACGAGACHVFRRGVIGVAWPPLADGPAQSGAAVGVIDGTLDGVFVAGVAP